MSTRSPFKTEELPSSADTATPLTRSDGAGESSTEWYEVRRDFNRFMLGDFVKLTELGPLPSGPLEPERIPHSRSCTCGTCLTAAQRRSDWDKARRLDEI